MKSLMGKVFILLKPYGKKECIGIVLMFLYSVTVFLIPKASQYLIDDVIPSNSYDTLYIGVAIFIMICLLQPIIGYFKDKLFLIISETVTYDIRKVIFKNILYSDFEFFSKVKGGDLISIVMNDCRIASDFISKIFANILKNILMIIMIFIEMLMISYKITLSILAAFFILYLFNLIFGKRLQRLSKRTLMIFLLQHSVEILPIYRKIQS